MNFFFWTQPVGWVKQCAPNKKNTDGFASLNPSYMTIYHISYGHENRLNKTIIPVLSSYNSTSDNRSMSFNFGINVVRRFFTMVSRA